VSWRPGGAGTPLSVDLAGRVRSFWEPEPPPVPSTQRFGFGKVCSLSNWCRKARRNAFICLLGISRSRPVPRRSRSRRPVDTWDGLDTSFGKPPIEGYKNEKPKLTSEAAEVSRALLVDPRRQRPDRSRGVSNLGASLVGYGLVRLRPVAIPTRPSPRSRAVVMAEALEALRSKWRRPPKGCPLRRDRVSSCSFRVRCRIFDSFRFPRSCSLIGGHGHANGSCGSAAP
jgi:hypothetical protein